MRRAGTRLGPVLVGLSLFIAPSAWASGDVETRLARLQAEVERVVRDVEGVRAEVVPGRATFLGESEARRRFEEHLYQFMVGEYEPAAEGFFVLVTTGSLGHVGLHRDAEWYMAEALFKMGNYGTAEARFQVIIDDRSHPFRDDAVRRQLELLAVTGQTERFYEAYEREILTGRVEPSDLIRYSVGKALFRQGDVLRAKASLFDIVEGSPQFARAQYVLGAIAITEDALGEAISHFQQVVAVDAVSVEERELRDLGRLALARIAYETGDFEAANTHYQQIDPGSPYYADALHELVATYIKQQEYGLALPVVEIFLLSFPDHLYAARLNLTRGHLMLREQHYQDALGAYEYVIGDFTPLRHRFGELATATDEPAAFFARVAALDRAAGPGGDIPAYAMAMMDADPDLDRALTLHRELIRQDRDVAACELLIEELEELLVDATGVGGYDRTRYDVLLLRNNSMQHQLDLLALEERWLQRALPGDREVATLGGRLQDVRARFLDADLQHEHARNGRMATDADLMPTMVTDRLLTEVADLREAFRHVRLRAAAPEAAQLGPRIDGLHDKLRQADVVLARVEVDLGSVELTELARIRDRFQVEAESVAQQREELGRVTAEAQEVSLALTQRGFGRLEGFFAQAVEGADIGIVNVYWNELRDTTDHRAQSARRMNDVLREFEQRAHVIRQKMR